MPSCLRAFLAGGAGVLVTCGWMPVALADLENDQVSVRLIAPLQSQRNLLAPIVLGHGINVNPVLTVVDDGPEFVEADELYTLDLESPDTVRLTIASSSGSPVGPRVLTIEGIDAPLLDATIIEQPATGAAATVTNAGPTYGAVTITLPESPGETGPMELVAKLVFAPGFEPQPIQSLVGQGLSSRLTFLNVPNVWGLPGEASASLEPVVGFVTEPGADFEASLGATGDIVFDLSDTTAQLTLDTSNLGQRTLQFEVGDLRQLDGVVVTESTLDSVVLAVDRDGFLLTIDEPFTGGIETVSFEFVFFELTPFATMPEPAVIESNEDLVFAVEIDDVLGPVTLRWQRNGVSLSNGETRSGSVIAGVNSPTLTISNATTDDTGYYRVRATPEEFGPVLSEPALGTVLPPATGRSDFNADGSRDLDDVLRFFVELES